MYKNLLVLVAVLFIFAACSNPAEPPAPTYSITYELNSDNASGLEPVETTLFKKGEEHTVLGVDGFSLTGFTFVEWNTQADGNGTAYQPGETVIVETADVSLYAIWQINQYTLSFDLQGGTAGADGAAAQTADYQSSATVAAAPSKTGYTFVEWNTAESGNGTAYAPGASYVFTNAAGITLYAIWQINQYNVSYNLNGGTAGAGGAAVQTADYQATVKVASALSRTGYTFVEWNSAADGNGTAYAAGASLTLAASDVVLSAIWQINQYDVNYDLNGGTAGAGGAAVQTVDYQASVTVASAPSKTGHTFVEWNTSADGNGTAYAAGASLTLAASDVVLSAIWQINQYDVSYDLNGGTAGAGGAAVQTADYQASVTVASAPSKTGYTFVEWNTSADGNGTAYAAGASLTLTASDVVLIAIWVPNHTVGTEVDMKNTIVEIVNEDGEVLGDSITLVPGQDYVLSVSGTFASYRWYVNGSRYSDRTITISPYPGVTGVTVVVTDADGDVFSASLIVNAYNAVSL